MRPEIGIGAAIYRKNASQPGYDLLLVQRAHPPGRGLWALPGGHLSWGESLADALQREMAEELHITIDIGPLIYVGELLGSDYHFVILDYAATVREGEPTPDSDAHDYRWINLADIRSLLLAPGMTDFLANSEVRRTLHWDNT